MTPPDRPAATDRLVDCVPPHPNADKSDAEILASMKEIVMSMPDRPARNMREEMMDCYQFGTVPAPQPATDLDARVALVDPLLKLVEYGVPPYVQELLIYGSKTKGIRPGALDAVLSPLRERVAALAPFVSKAHEFQREAADLRIGKEAAEARATAAEARVAELEAALRPLAEKFLYPDDIDNDMPPGSRIADDPDHDATENNEQVDDVWIKRGDIRRARAALNGGMK